MCESVTPHIVHNATCTACGCLCDDITLSVQDNCRITHAQRACTLGEAWFLSQPASDQVSCLIDGQPAELVEGYDRAAEILCAAKYPLVLGLAEAPLQTQRLAVTIADWIGACVDTFPGAGQASTLALQGAGAVTATLGEVAQRGDLVIFWGTNPVVSHPRHFERYSLEPHGTSVPGGRPDRTCVVVDVTKTETAALADVFLSVKPGKDFEALWTLRALAAGIDIDGQTVQRQTGVALREWQNLSRRMRSCRYGAIFYGSGLGNSESQYANYEALLHLARDMNRHTRFVALPMGARGNAAGGENVLTWHTGYAFAVNLARGFPRYGPGEYTADKLLAQREVDAALLIGCGRELKLTSPARQHLESIPVVSIDDARAPTNADARVSFTVATYSINTGGTVYRVDGVPLPLRPAVPSSHPTSQLVLENIERRVMAYMGIRG